MQKQGTYHGVKHHHLIQKVYNYLTYSSIRMLLKIDLYVYFVKVPLLPSIMQCIHVFTHIIYIYIYGSTKLSLGNCNKSSSLSTTKKIKNSCLKSPFNVWLSQNARMDKSVCMCVCVCVCVCVCICMCVYLYVCLDGIDVGN